MKRLAISLACSILVSGCASVSGLDTAIENTVKIVQSTSKPKPTIILAHGCDGMTARQHYYFSAKEIAEWGYNVVMVDSFTKRRVTNICTEGTVVMPAERAVDIAEAAKWVIEQPWHKGKVGLIGYSHGGSTALNIVGDKHIKHISAVVAYYPPCWKFFVGQDYRYGFIPLQIHGGDQDFWTPPSVCNKLISGPTDQPYDLFIYKGATHSFNFNYSGTIYGQYMTYNNEVDKLAAGRTREFFNKHIMN
jgi:dienelactone hydrolase